MSYNEMMLRIDGTLHIVTDDPAASTACGHRARIGVGQRYLLVFGLHHLSVEYIEALYLLAQRRNLLVEPRNLGFRYRFPLAIGAVELREVASYTLINLLQPPLHLGLGEVPVTRVDGFELTAVNRDDRLGEEFKAPAQHHKLTADPPDGLAIVLPEVGYCLEVRHQPAGQPNQLDIALALPLQAPGRVAVVITERAECLKVDRRAIWKAAMQEAYLLHTAKAGIPSGAKTNPAIRSRRLMSASNELGVTLTLQRSCDPSGRSHDRGEAGSMTFHSASARPRSACP